ncbi:LysM-like peptidoglycan-binding domain-containing protein [Testudinibacter sp. P80/BLE/0925]|uniref:LysM-like peptidoglycan-binding domain-containing protein n=1 Tax=Testudinibacter sp. TW-1 TaxID=3417757 RepID=UPI003D35BCFF
MTSDNPQKTGDNDVSSHEKQNQLKFEFSNMEPITPKKPIEEKPSFLDKAKGLLPKREHKEESVNPTNPQQPTQAANMEANVETISETAAETANLNAGSAKREPLSQRLKKPETWELLNRLPAKHRRLFIALLALILVLLIFFWLKPSSTTTVDALQAQNANSLPIEFQPLNQSEEDVVNQPLEQNAEANVLLPNNTAGQSDSGVPTPSDSTANSAAATALAQQTQSAQTETAQSATQAAQVAQPAKKATATPTRNTAGVAKEPVKKAETSKATSAPKTTASAKTNNTAAATESTSSRTLTIPQGVSLMQVFRNNNLNIADVNAMTKTNGGEKALSRFKPGDKVTIQLNSQGRVNRLTLQNGASFSRNSDGSYSYKP